MLCFHYNQYKMVNLSTEYEKKSKGNHGKPITHVKNLTMYSSKIFSENGYEMKMFIRELFPMHKLQNSEVHWPAMTLALSW